MLWWLPKIGVAAAPTRPEELIPFTQLTATNRALVRAVTDHYTLRREYPARQFPGETASLEFLMDHIEACSLLAHQLKLITYRVTTDEQGRACANDGEGSQGCILLVRREPGKRIYYIAGSRRGAIFTARGRGVAVLEYKQVVPGKLEYTATVFVKVDNPVLAALTEMFALFLKDTVDKNFEHVMRHPLKLSTLALEEPQKLREAIRDMPEGARQKLMPFFDLLPPR